MSARIASRPPVPPTPQAAVRSTAETGALVRHPARVDGVLLSLALAIAGATALAARLAPATASAGWLPMPATLPIVVASTALALAVAACAVRAFTVWVGPLAVLAAVAAAVRAAVDRGVSPGAEAGAALDPLQLVSSPCATWAAACLLLAAVLALRPSSPRALRLARWSGTLMSLGAALAVVVAALGVEYLYSPALFKDAGIESPLLTLSIALAQWRLAARGGEHGRSRPAVEDRIVRSAALVLGVALSVTAAVAFFEMRHQIERDKGDLLGTDLIHQVNRLATGINSGRENAAAVAARPAALAALTALHRAEDGSPAQAAARLALHSVLAGLTDSGFVSFTVLDAMGREAAVVGRPILAPLVVLNLAMPGVQLLWSDGYVLRTSAVAQSGGVVVGHLIAEQPLMRDGPQALGSINGQGATGELELCSLQGEQVVCLPSRFSPRGQLRPLATPARLPSDRAVTGERDAVWELDHRGKRVLAALLPAPELNLGLVAKRDADEVLRPVRRLAEWGLPLLTLVVGAAYWLLARRLKPMARAVVEAKRDAERHASKWAALNQAALDGFLMLRPLHEADGLIRDWKIADLNPAAERLLRLRRDAALAQPVSTLLGRGPAGELGRHCAEALASNRPTTFESAIHREGVARQWLHYNVVPFRGGVALTIKDLTLRRNAEQAARDNERRLQTITDQMPAMIAVVDTQHVFRFNNLACEQWFDRPLARITGHPVAEVLSEQAGAATVQAMAQAAASSAALTVEHACGGFGSHAVVEISYIPQFDEADVLTGFCLLGRDVTASKAREHRLVLAAQQDTLTGLPNRAAFSARLARSLQQMNDGGRGFSVAYVDLDFFKQVNDTHGHAAGDELLRAFGERVSGVLRGSDMVARLGGDEFALVFEELDDPAHAENVARNLYAAFAQPVRFKDVSLRISASIGLTLALPGDVPAELLMRADEALYAAKARGRNNCVVAPLPVVHVG